jgi:TonB family protein
MSRARRGLGRRRAVRHGIGPFEVRKNGSLRKVEIVKSSGVRLLDSYIENAIRLAAPFPPFPATIGEDVLPISLDFRYATPRRGSVSP